MPKKIFFIIISFLLIIPVFNPAEAAYLESFNFKISADQGDLKAERMLYNTEIYVYGGQVSASLEKDDDTIGINGEYDREKGILEAEFIISTKDDGKKETANGLINGQMNSDNSQMEIGVTGQIKIAEETNRSDEAENIIKLEKKFIVSLAGDLNSDVGLRVTNINGQLEISPNPDVLAGEPVNLGTVIKTGDHIMSGASSTCTMRFINKLEIAVKPHSEIIFPSKLSEELKIILIRGEVLSQPKSEANKNFLLDLNRVSASSEKGVFSGEVREGTSTVKVLSGKVNLNIKNSSEAAVLNSGEMISVTDIGFGEIKKFDVKSENEDWEKVKMGNFIEKQAENNSELSKAAGQASPEKNLWSFRIYALIALILAIILFIYLRLKNKSL